MPISVEDTVSRFNILSSWFLGDPAARFVLYGYALQDLARVFLSMEQYFIECATEDFPDTSEDVYEVLQIVNGKGPTSLYPPTWQLKFSQTGGAKQALRRCLVYSAEIQTERTRVKGASLSAELGLSRGAGRGTYTSPEGVVIAVACMIADQVSGCPEHTKTFVLDTIQDGDFVLRAPETTLLMEASADLGNTQIPAALAAAVEAY